MLIMAAPKVCSDLQEVWQIVGWILWVFKIVIPIIIIIFGMIDLGKAVVASKDDEIKKSIKSLAMRAVAGVIIFFIPALVAAIFGMVDSFQEVEGEYAVCELCIKNPGKCGSNAGSGNNDRGTKESCTSAGGVWDSKTNTCQGI
ncbi:MAG: hypothetical protein HFI36_03750 [Bacilli bacterium]|jgi:hypothetical protein|nr:hypothetical protein [Bacilli bacterium]MCX4254241.1 hypothetical protein [Bacilli bacterium]